MSVSITYSVCTDYHLLHVYISKVIFCAFVPLLLYGTRILPGHKCFVVFSADASRRAQIGLEYLQ